MERNTTGAMVGCCVQHLKNHSQTIARVAIPLTGVVSVEEDQLRYLTATRPMPLADHVRAAARKLQQATPMQPYGLSMVEATQFTAAQRSTTSPLNATAKFPICIIGECDRSSVCWKKKQQQGCGVCFCSAALEQVTACCACPTQRHCVCFLLRSNAHWLAHDLFPVDSGVEITHPALVGVRHVGEPTASDLTGYRTDWCSHGTHVAGTVAGRGT